MRKFLLLMVAVLLLCAPHALYAQKDQNFERGFAPAKMYQFGDLDHVNLFNGNVVIAIPIGGSYPLGGGASYSLVLRYNSTIWEYRELFPRSGPPDNQKHPWAYPTRRSNAGVGWTLSLGRVLDTYNADGDLEKTVYESPDGNDSRLSLSGTVPQTVTNDSKYLRWDPDHSVLLSPNGTKSAFALAGSEAANAKGWLTSMTDAYGNQVTVEQTYDANGMLASWIIRDSHQRAHTVYFKPFNTPVISYLPAHADLTNYRTVIDKVVVQTGNGDATYQFVYKNEAGQLDQPTTIAGGTGGGSQGWPSSFDVPLLRELQLPEGSKYAFDYYTGANTSQSSEPGQIRSMTLPTLGKISWTFGAYKFPQDGTVCGVAGWRSTNFGVRTRQFTDPQAPAGSQDLGTWTYTPALQDPVARSCQGTNHNGDPITKFYDEDRTLTNTVTTPAGNKEVNYFTAALNDGPVVSVLEYGTPQTRLHLDDTGRRGLSTEYFDCSSGTCPPAATRRKYIQYVFDGTSFDPEGRIAHLSIDSNPRVQSERTEFNDGSHIYHDTDYSDFDGFGHYRQTTVTRRNASNQIDFTQTSYTNYNAGTNENGFRGTAYAFSATDPWILHTYSEQWASDGAHSSRSEACFNPADGSLLRVRTLLDDQPAPAAIERRAHDLLAVYDYDHGNVTKERYYGGDTQDLTTSSGCSAALPVSPRYELHHGYDYGVRSSSEYFSGGASLGFKSLDLTIHPSGAVSKQRDVAGRETTFTYKPLWGALASVTPPGEAATTYDYTNAAVDAAGHLVPATVTATRGDTQTMYSFDALGRSTRERQLLPDGTCSVRETHYDKAGRKDRVTEPVGIPCSDPWSTMDLSSAPKTTLAYDAFDRPTTTTAPDQHSIAFSYSGVSSTTRTVTIKTSATSSETPSSTTETYDRLGRLVSVSEPSGSGGTPVVTYYGYDIGGRLASVSTASGTVSQPRQFVYDNRGFLKSETHPENGLTYYDGYDARGHATYKLAGGGQTPFDLKFTYDDAERMTEVGGRNPLYEAGNPAPDRQQFRPLKHFDFATANSGSNYQKGKVATAVRYNYPPSPGASEAYLGTDIIRVSETYSYVDAAGRMTDRRTEIDKSASLSGGWSAIRKLDQHVDYNDLGLPATIRYPACADCAQSTGSPVRNVSPTYAGGRLTAINGIVNAVTYWPNGMTHTIQHANGVTDTILPDPSGMPRPGSISAGPYTTCQAPAITSVTQDQTVPAGTQLDLQATGTGTSFEWYRVGSPNDALISSTSAAHVTVQTTTRYYVKTINSCGSAISYVTITVPLPAPTGLVATMSGPAQITVQWNSSATGTQYIVQRKSNGSAFTDILPAISETSFIDGNRAANTTYVYRVRAVDASGGSASAYSNADLATTIAFSTVVANQSLLQPQPLDQLLLAVNAVRAAQGSAAVTWLDILPSTDGPPAAGGTIRASHITSLRAKMNDALQALGLPAPPYTVPDAALSLFVAGNILELQQRAQ
jgi:YD repeat-containing protein